MKPTMKQPQPPRVKEDQHKDELRVLKTATPLKLAQAEVQSYGVRKARKAS